MTPALETYLAEVEAAEGKMTSGEWIIYPVGDQGGIYLGPIKKELTEDNCEGVVCELPGTWFDKSAHPDQPPEEWCNCINDAIGIALLRNRVKALCGMVRDAVSTLEAITVCTSDRQRIIEAADHSLARIAAVVALIAKGQGGRESLTIEPK